ncbi:hypothetical protein E2C01_060331 [Portunus trituberculatus]|uniref:Uncharacterized protein n=1 Tax=Portunus trituberculatus TaxID=210409 RepID=A0A5B7HBR8_PORTR|nr:hypothetical protein [Portunus trituberculatus]
MLWAPTTQGRVESGGSRIPTERGRLSSPLVNEGCAPFHCFSLDGVAVVQDVPQGMVSALGCLVFREIIFRGTVASPSQRYATSHPDRDGVPILLTNRAGARLPLPWAAAFVCRTSMVGQQQVVSFANHHLSHMPSIT